MEILIKREWFTAKSTIGNMFIDVNDFCFTLEDCLRPDGFKVPGATCIPAGRYRLVLDWSNRFQRIMPHILDVKGFEGVRIHWGNDDVDTEGCPLVGFVHSPSIEDFIGQSVKAFDCLFLKMVLCLVNKEEMWITII